MKVFKVCTKCGKELSATLDNFNKMLRGKHGLRSICKPCAKKIRKTPEYKEKARIKAAEWRKKNPEKALARSREQYRLHGDKLNKQKRERYKTEAKVRAKAKASGKRYAESGRRKEINNRPENKEKDRLKSKQYRADNHELILIKYRKNREKYRTLNRKRRENLYDGYVAQIIAKGLNIPPKSVNKELIEVKKLIIKINRLIKQKSL